MSEIVYKNDFSFTEKDILSLYDNVGWVEYTKNTKKLIRALKNSLYILTAWDDNKLVGLIRIVGDEETIIYIQDILVLKEYQRQGIGSQLLKAVLDKYNRVRQIVLLTDDTEKTKLFYKANGFEPANKLNLVSYVIINN
ncbi:GNAT family N-acetyltransferase [Halothermothrix orenii]|uniref:GCN5-related N-acetyltransferase n=1 Tax=Halothermothrix orenii (strain H 168 / OCM 544 / DSM 9562) TaxID=373903 RepID=B8CXS7_HALOH|nr:GNAT family N-acetyltransferase [Halothermothrix orenii]ACL70096.1 GCN5-related N-acetyltransferase [Halothermothrix orenii H 168]